MNINKPCIQCKKIVYPLEQLKCSDQIWHRRCFRCQVCNMALNMGNYRGYDKKPYCVAHYPQPKRFTVVADTPELQRVAQNTRAMSTTNYNREARRLSAMGSSMDSDRVRSPRWEENRRFSELSFNSQATSIDRTQRVSKSTEPNGDASSVQPNSHAQYRTEYKTANLIGSQTNPSAGHVKNGNSTTAGLYNLERPILNNGHADTRASPSVRNVQPQYQDVPSTDATPDHPNDTDPDAVLQSSAMMGHQSIPQLDPAQYSLTPFDPDTKFRAMFDYEAKEDDEVTFMEGDIIVNGDPITEGWMYGSVQRTGQFGMLPSNYVKAI